MNVDIFDGKVILITGGTGSFGNYFTDYLVKHCKPKKIIIFSRDEYKQFIMKNKFSKYNEIIRYFIGDIRDKERLLRAFDGVDYVVHAAAMKQVPACEYNPIEAIKTNIHGAMNVIEAALDRNVKKVVALSTDKSVRPVNLYGGTKLVSDKLFISANAYSAGTKTNFSVVRYGNVAGSRGSVIPFFMSQIQQGKQSLPITDYRMTRFWIDLEQGVELVLRAFNYARGGEVYISKIPSFNITDLAQAMAPNCEMTQVGIREGEKLHEVMITQEDAPYTYEYDKFFVIYPCMEFWKYSPESYIQGGKKVAPDFEYNSGTNNWWLSIDELTERVKNLEMLK